MVKGTISPKQRRIVIALSEDNFAFFNDVCEKYSIPFTRAVDMFLTANIAIEKEMALDGLPFNFAKKKD